MYFIAILLFEPRIFGATYFSLNCLAQPGVVDKAVLIAGREILVLGDSLGEHVEAKILGYPSGAKGIQQT
jgi:hypothetical protein